MIEWTSSQLNILASSPIVSLHIHVTRKESEESSRNSLLPLSNFISSIPLDLSSSSDTEKVLNSYFTVNKFPNNTETKEIRSTVTSDTYVKAAMVLNQGRPDINSQISHAVNTSSITDRIAIVACGPDAMMVNIRRVVAENIRPEGPSLQLFSEQFGW